MIKLKSIVLILLLNPFNLFALQFMVDSEPLHPDFALYLDDYRAGTSIAINEDNKLLYIGDVVYFIKSDSSQNLNEWKFKVGIKGGAKISASQNSRTRCCSIDTLDGHYGLNIEFMKERWGWGLEFNHHSAHTSDGVYKDLPYQTVKVHYPSLKGVFNVNSTLHVQGRFHWYISDQPWDRPAGFDVGIGWRALPYLNIESFALFSFKDPAFESARLKLSFWYPSESYSRLIPYLLIHQGRHYIGHRYLENITEITAGLEVRI
jgi:hypothetical protein